MNEFPLGSTIPIEGGLEIVVRLAGEPAKGRYRALRPGAPTGSALITTGTGLAVSDDDAASLLAMQGVGIADVLGVAHLTWGGLDYAVVAEAEPMGSSSATVEFRREQALRCGVALGRVVDSYHAAVGQALVAVRPDTTYVANLDKGPTVTIAPRCEIFWTLLAEVDFGVPYPFRTIFQAPEVLMGLGPDYPSDVFSVAATVFTWLTGVHPFVGDDAISQTNALVSGSRRPSLSERQVPAILERGLAARPGDRPTMAELLDGLSAATLG